MKIDILKTAGRAVIMFAFQVFMYGCLLMFLWNLTMPQNFGLPYLTFGQAGMFFIIARLLVKPHLIEMLMAWHFHFVTRHDKFEPENNSHVSVETKMGDIHSSVIIELSKRTNMPPSKILFHVFNYGFDYLMLIKNPDNDMNIILHKKKLENVLVDHDIKLLAEKIQEYVLEMQSKK